MFLSLVSTLRWILSLGSKFARVVPFSTIFIIGLTLVSQISMLIASLMPLKVVILLGTDEVPKYFPSFLSNYGHDVLIGLLSFATIAFFLLHIFSEKLITWRTEKSTSMLLIKSEKMSLFERQEQVAQNAYLRFSRALASSIFVLLSFSGLSVFYPALLLTHIGYIALVSVLLWFLSYTNKNFKDKLELKPAPTFNLIAVIGFFVTFGFLVVDFLFFNAPTPLIAIVSLLLTRQVMNRISGVIVDLFQLKKERIKLDALFFHSKVFLPQVVGPHDGIWSLLQTSVRNQWISVILSEFGLNKDNKKIYTSWRQLGATNVGALQVTVDFRDYLFKIYELNRSSQAKHELMLLSENSKELPALQLIGGTQIEGFNCLVYRLVNGATPEFSTYRNSLLRFRIELLATPVTSKFANHYQRSKPLLWQRLKLLPLERLQMAANTVEDKVLLEQFYKCLPKINQILSSVPLSVLNPSTSKDALWLLSEAECISLQWGEWSLEPVGAGWPESETDLKKLNHFWPQIVKKRRDLKNVSLRHVEIAALVFALERDFNRQRFSQVLGLLPSILGRLEEPIKDKESDS